MIQLKRMPIFAYEDDYAGLLFIQPTNILINDSHLASGMLGFGNHTSIPKFSLSWLAFATSDDKKDRN